MSVFVVKIPGSRDVCTYMASAMYDARTSASIFCCRETRKNVCKLYLDMLRKLPGLESMYLVSTELNFGTHESRHMNSPYQLTEADIMNGRSFDYTVVVESWYMEWHDGSKEDWPTLFKAPPDGTFEIPLRCLQSMHTQNLFCAGHCADGDHAASSTIRVMSTSLATGQAAGTKAALYDLYEHGPDAHEIRHKLLKHGALLDRHNLVTPAEVKEFKGLNLTHDGALKAQ